MTHSLSQTRTAQRILVTGGAGFIGSHTIDLLLSQGHQVTVLDNLSSGQLKNLDLKHPDLAFIEGDILEYPLLEELIDASDAVLHLAAIASVPLSIEDPIYTFQVNTQGFLHVLQAIQKINRVIKLVYASSAAVYGNSTTLPCLDSVPLSNAPLSPYALQKIHAENYADFYARHYGLKSLGLRYFNVYGQRQDPQSPYSGVISRFLDAYQNKRNLYIFGDGLQSRDFIHVSDVAIANVLALQSDCHGVLNIATGQPQTIIQLIEYIQQAGRYSPLLQFEPARTGDIQSSYGSTEKALQMLEFKYATSLKEGIKLMIEN